MRTLLIAVRSLFKKGRHNILKIDTLSIGLAVGLVLIATVYFDQSYDDFYPDGDRIYRLTQHITQDGKNRDWAQVAGGVAPGMCVEVPGVEVATRLTFAGGKETTFATIDKRQYTAHNVVLADSCLFDILPRPILWGDPKEVLSRPDHAMISRSLAERMGGVDKVSGVLFTIDRIPTQKYVIGGVFEDVPSNSHLRYDIVISLNAMAEQSRNNWVGNDRYLGYVKLTPGVTPESLRPAIEEMEKRHIDQEMMKKAGVQLSYFLKPMREMHSGTESVRSRMIMLSILALILLFTAVTNYILITISSIVNRTKEVAVHKSYGASETDIHRIILSETLVHTLLSVALAIFLVFACSNVVTDLLDVTVPDLLLSRGAMVLAGVCVGVFCVAGFIPGSLFARIPVAAAFRNFQESRRVWKLGLLFFQFAAGTLLVSLLIVVGQQHLFMVNNHPGYSYAQLAYGHIFGVDSTRRAKIIEEVSRIPEVAKVSSSDYLPLSFMSGNNVMLPGDPKELFNASDQYSCSNGFLDLMEIPVVEGRSFTENTHPSNEIMVNRLFAETICKATNWTDGVVGKEIAITEHRYQVPSEEGWSNIYRICGVYENYRIGSLSHMDTRPSVLFYDSSPRAILLVKYHQLNAAGIEKVNAVLQELIPGQERKMHIYSQELGNLYTNSRKFRDQVLIGGLVALLISLIGLIGYINDEVNRRRKEIAIRKVNGATMGEIQRIFLIDIIRISAPATIIGSMFAYFIAEKWQAQFVEKIALSPGIFIGGAAIVTLCALLSVVFRTAYTVREKVVESLNR